MAEQQFKAMSRLNRWLLVALLAATLWRLGHEPALFGRSLLIGLCLCHGVALIANEFLLKLTKRLREAEIQTIMHLGIFMPLCVALYTAVCYLASGSLMVYGLAFVAILEAQLFDQEKLAGVLTVSWLGLYAVGMIVGWPHPVSLTPPALALSAVGVGGCLFYFGRAVASLLNSHANQVGKLQSMAVTDVLTGLTNRRQFNNRLQEEVARARRHQTPLSLALFDLDNFKRLNDQYGHPAGDRILRELGKLIRQNIRESDLPARYGGEEFALILPETRETEAYELLERIRLLVAQSVFSLPENPLTTTISVGVVQLESRSQNTFELVELADKALYEAKRLGKNQVVRASALAAKILLQKPGTRPAG